MPGSKISRLLGSTLLHVLVVSVLGLAAYSNTFDNPLQWDDKSFIAENPVVKDLAYFADPSLAKALDGEDSPEPDYYYALKSRYVGYLTFALNYRLHGLDVAGYHLFNLSIHIMNALLVYFLALLIFGSPFLGKCALKDNARYVAFFSASLFVSHPVQTEAVTYIFQRLASLSAFFYLLSVVLYIRGKSSSGLPWYLLYALSLVSAVLAMKTKENAFTLPVVLLLVEFLFYKGPLRHRLPPLAPYFLMVFIIPLTVVGTDRLDELARGYPEISRKDYLLTEFRVVSTYLRLIFLPSSQNLDYDYPLFDSIYNPEVLLSFLFFIVIIGGAFYLYHRSRFRTPSSRVVAFGIFWFFITLSVESSVIPAMRVIDEYRLYLPTAGFFIGLMSGAFIFFGKIGSVALQRFMMGAVLIAALALSYATYERNDIWQSPEDLWMDAVRKSPHKALPHMNLGVAYYAGGMINGAIEHYEAALALKPDFAEAHYNLGVALAGSGRTEEALEHYRVAVRVKPDYARAHYNMGILYDAMGLTDDAIRHYLAAADLTPGNARARNNLGAAYAAKGLTDDALRQFALAASARSAAPEDYAMAHYNIGLIYASRGLTGRAIEHLQTALTHQPENIKAHNNLGVAFAVKGMTDGAIEHFHAVLRIEPGHADAHYNLALAYMTKGLASEAVMHLSETLKSRPDFAAAHLSLATIYYEQGLTDDARRELQETLRLDPHNAEAGRLHKAVERKSL